MKARDAALVLLVTVLTVRASVAGPVPTPVDSAPPKVKVDGQVKVAGAGAPDDDHFTPFRPAGLNPGSPFDPNGGGQGLRQLPNGAPGGAAVDPNNPGDPGTGLAQPGGGGSEGRRAPKPQGSEGGRSAAGGSEGARDGVSPADATPFTNSQEFGSEGRGGGGGSEGR